MRAHPRPHYRGADGFGQVVHTAGGKAFDLIGNIVQGRDKNHGHGGRLRLGLERAADRVAIHARHHHIEQNQIGRVFPRQLQRPLAISGELQAVLLLQHLAQDL